MELDRMYYIKDTVMRCPKILLVDENQTASKQIFHSLKKLGYDISGNAFSIEEAVLQAKSVKPDLVLLDATLIRNENDDSNGSQFWVKMDIPVVYLVNDDQEALEVTRTLNCNYGVLVKLTKSQNIKTTIEVALQKHLLELQLQENVIKTHQVYDLAPVILFSFTSDGLIKYVNRQWISTTGYSAEETLGQKIDFNLTPESAQTFHGTIFPEIIRIKRVNQIPIDFIKKDGTILNGILDAILDFEMDGNSLGLAVVRDVTINTRLFEEEKAQLALAEALRETAGLLTSTLNFDEVLDRILGNVGNVVPHDAANIMMSWAGKAYVVRFQGYTDFGLDEFMISLQLSVADVPNLDTMYRTGLPVAIPDMDLYPEVKTQPEMNWRKSVASAPLRSRGVVFGFLNLESATPGFFNQNHADRLQAFADQAAIAIENARLYAEVQQSAITDELTSVYNRRGLMELGRREMERARRYMRDLSILMVDIDHFKEINDQHCHEVGDQVLVELAKRWKTSLREVDLLGRLGGDEFIILLPETDLDSAMRVAQRLLFEISENPFSTEDGEINVTVSIGVAGVGQDILELQEIISLADNAMYSAKKTGRNKVVLAGKIGN